MATPNQSTELAEIEAGLGKLIWVIENHSEAAWPLFDRLEREYEQRQSRATRLARFRQLRH
ncbi:MAG: hypothetical protein AAF311_12945 [Pseudomonadota bacterium]